MLLIRVDDQLSGVAGSNPFDAASNPRNQIVAPELRALDAQPLARYRRDAIFAEEHVELALVGDAADLAARLARCELRIRRASMQPGVRIIPVHRVEPSIEPILDFGRVVFD